MANFIVYREENNVGILTLNRPDKLNSFNTEMALTLQNKLSEIIEDRKQGRGVRALILTGNGRAFSAGQDLAEAAPTEKPWPPIDGIVRNSYNPIVVLIRKIPIPVICAVNGIAAGAGANIALSGDFVIASEKASFMQAFCHIGLVPDSGGTFFLPRLIGFARATQMMMLGEKITAQQAVEWGMIYSVSSPENLESDSIALAEKLAKMPTKALGLMKEALNSSYNSNLNEQLVLEAKLQAKAANSADYKEGVNAFLEKRKPKYIGK